MPFVFWSHMGEKRDGRAGVDVITAALFKKKKKKKKDGLARSLAQMLLRNSSLKMKALLFSIGFHPLGAAGPALAVWSWADAHCQLQEVKPRPLMMNHQASQRMDGHSTVQRLWARDIKRLLRLHMYLAKMTYHNVDLNQRGFTEP